MKAGLHGSEVAEHPGLPSRALAVFRSSPTQGPDSPRRSRSGAQLLCSPPLAPSSPSPAVCCSRGFRPQVLSKDALTPGTTQRFSPGPSCPSGDTGRYLGTRVAVVTGVLLALRGGVWAAAQPPTVLGTCPH